MKRKVFFVIAVVMLVITTLFSVSGLQNASDVIIAENSDDFLSLVSDMIDGNRGDVLCSDVEVDLSSNQNIVDGSIKEIQNGKAGIRLYSVVGEKIPELNNSESDSEEYLTLSEVEDLGFELVFGEEKITVLNTFATKRLVVNTSVLTDTFCAKSAVGDGKGMFVLQYDSIEKVKNAYDELKTLYGEENVSVDRILRLLDDKSSLLSQQERNRNAAERIESDRYAQYLKENGFNEEITVAVIDSGLDVSHPLFEGRISDKSKSVINNSEDVADVSGHGTHVAGIIADNTPDNVKIMALRCFYEDGVTTEVLVKLAINYAVENGAEVINMSLGGAYSKYDCILESVIKNAVKAGVVCVVGAGNDGEDVSGTCPARYEECITVGSVNSADVRSSFSNYGKQVDIVAPGEDIWSAVPVSMGSYDCYSGTSMATPFVTAATAMIKLSMKDETVAEVETKLKQATVDLGLKGSDNHYGAGVLDFGVLLGDFVEAESISIKGEELNYYKWGNSNGLQPSIPEFVFEPSDVTDKSISVEYLTDLREPYFDGYTVSAYHEKMKDDEPRLRFIASNGKSCEYTVNIIKDEFWKSTSEKCKGEGTYNEPFVVENAKQLVYATSVLITESVYIELAGDIDLEGRSWYPVVKKDSDGMWIPLYINGNGHTIYNLTMKDYNSGLFTEYVGLFGVNSGEIKNLNLINANIDCPSAAYVGAICGYSSGMIKNCYVSGTINGKTVGAIVGKMGNMTESAYGVGIADCRSDAVVSGNVAGGIVGAMENGIVNNCISLATVNGDISGGIAGLMKSVNGAYSIELYVDRSKIINCLSASNIAGEKQFGYNVRNKFTPEIDCCYCVSKVPVEKDCDAESTSAFTVAEDKFKEKSFYSGSSWNVDYKWNSSGKSWTLNGDYPTVLPVNSDRLVSFFSYVDSGDGIKLIKYFGPGGTVEIPGYINNKPVKYIGMDVFPDNVRVKRVILPDTIEFIGAQAFVNDQYICAFDFGEGVKRLDMMAFSGCVLLTDIILPESVEEIGNYVFAYSGLKKVAFYGDATDRMGRFAFDELVDGMAQGYTINGKKIGKFVNISISARDADKASVLLSQTYLYLAKNERLTLWAATFPKKENISFSASKSSYYKFTSGDSVLGIKESGWNSVSSVTAESSSSKRKITVIVDGTSNGVIAFDGNGADSGKMYPIKERYGNPFTFPECAYTKKGFRFIGWGSKADGYAEYYAHKIYTSIVVSAETKTFYAIWVPVFENVEIAEVSPDVTSVAFTWKNVKNASVYKVYQEIDSEWKALGTVTKTTAVIKNLTAGTKYTFAVKAGAIVGGKKVWQDGYTVLNTATKAVAPSKVTATQNTGAIKLTWTASAGSDGYRIFYKTGGKWKITVNSTTATSHTFKNLKSGAKYTFAIQPYVKTESGVVWSEYAEFTTSTAPATPTVKASSPSKGKVTVKWNAVNGAESYQLYYKKGNGEYKLYKTYNKAGTLTFSNLTSGTKYTFAVRAVIKTSEGNVRSGYQTVAVKIK